VRPTALPQYIRDRLTDLSLSLQLNAAQNVGGATSCYYPSDSLKISNRKNMGAHNFSFALNFPQK